MLRLTGRAIRVGDGWVVEVPSRQLRVRVTTLADTDARVGQALRRRSSAAWSQGTTVRLSAYLTLDDCSPGKRRELSRMCGVTDPITAPTLSA